MLKYEGQNPVYIELAPNQATQATLTFINESLQIDTFSLSLEPDGNFEARPVPENWISFSETRFVLRPVLVGSRVSESESRQSVQLLLMLPGEAEAGTYSGTILVTAGSNPANRQTVPLQVVVSELEQQNLEVSPPEKTSRRSQEYYQITLRNDGNARHLYPVYAEDSDNDCQFEINPPEVLLLPGQAAPLTLKVRPRHRNWASKPVSYDFMVKLEGFPQETPARFVQKCALPPIFWLKQHWGRLMMLVAVLIGLATAAYLFLGNRNAPMVLSECGPAATRKISVVSNDETTTIGVGAAGGSLQFKDGVLPFQTVATLKASEMPGIFASLVSVSPDGRRLAYVTSDTRSAGLTLNGASIWVVDFDVSPPKTRQVATIPSGFWPIAPLWSPNGETLAYFQRAEANKAAPPTVNVTVPVTATIAAPALATTLPGKLDIFTAQIGDSSSSEKLKAIPVPSKEFQPGKVYQPDLKMFYGDSTRVSCWSKDSQSLIFQGRPGSDDTNFYQVNPKTGDTLQSDKARINPVSIKNPESNQAKVAQNATLRFSPPIQPIANNCAVRQPFSQLDPDWASLPLSRNPGETGQVGTYGCALVSLAMAFNVYSSGNNAFSPATLLNNCSPNTALFSPLRPVYWNTIYNCSNNQVQNSSYSEFSWAGLDKALGSGPALVGLLGGPTGSHYLVVTGGGGSQSADNYSVADPWDGSTYKSLGYFLNIGYKLNSLVAFSGGNLDCRTASPNSDLAPNVSGATNGQLSQIPLNLTISLNPSTPISTFLSYSPRQNSPGAISETENLSSGQSLTKDFTKEGIYLITAENRATPLFSFTIDQTAPVISHTIIGTKAATGDGYSSAVEVKLVAQDTLSGVRKLEYLDVTSGNPDWQEYNSDSTNTILKFSLDKNTVSKDYQIFYRAIDGAGNLSQQQEINFRLVQPPSPNGITATAGPAPTTVVKTVAPPPPPPLPTNTLVPVIVGPRATPTLAPTPTFTPVPATATVVSRPTTVVTTVAPVAVPTNTPAPVTPTPTAGPKPLLVVSTTQLNFDPTRDTLPLTILNQATTGSLNWNVVDSNDVRANLIFDPVSSGSLAPGASVDLNVRLRQLNFNDIANPNFSFNINSNGGSRVVQVAISKQTLPFASFVIPNTVDAKVIPIQLNVNAPTAAKPDHAAISVSYTDAKGNLVSKIVAPAVKPDAAGNWVFELNTSQLPSLSIITLNGKICVDVAETPSRCQNFLAPLTLTLPLDATINASTLPNSTVLTDTTTINISTPSARVDHVVLSYVIKSSQVVTLTDAGLKPGAVNNWNITFSTRPITPSVATVEALSGIDQNNQNVERNSVQIRGLACSSVDESFCVTIPDTKTVRNLVTWINGDVSYGLSNNQVINSGDTLPSNLPLVISMTNLTPNVNHMSVYAQYQDDIFGGKGPARLSTRALPVAQPNGTFAASYSWNTEGLPPQAGIKLSAFACYTADDSLCIRQGEPLTNLRIAFAQPYSITAVNQAQVLPVNASFGSGAPFLLTVKDKNGWPVHSVTVAYAVSCASGGPCGGFFSPTNPATVTTDISGVAVPPAFQTNAVSSGVYAGGNMSAGLYSVTATVNKSVAGTGSDLVATYSLWNSDSLVNPSYGIYPYRYSTPPDFFNYIKNTAVNLGPTKPAGTKFSLLAFLYSAGVAATNGNMLFYAPTDANGPGITSFSPTPGVLFPATVGAGGKTLAYNITIFSFFQGVNLAPLVDATTNCRAGNFNIIAVSNTPIPVPPAPAIPIPGVSGYYYQPAVFSLKTLPDVPDNAKSEVLPGSGGQAAVIGEGFNKRLQVIIKDGCGNPLSGVNVAFKAPKGDANTAGGAFVVSNNASPDAIVSTDSNGIAVAPLLIARGKEGAFSVTVTVASTPVVLTIPLTNLL